MLGRVKRWLLNTNTQVDTSTCIFCTKQFQQIEPYHYQDDNYYVITDINQASSVKHLLVITKKHYDNSLKVQDPSILLQMQKIGEKVLNNLCDKLEIKQRKFRFGFHIPPVNSIDHLHLHCFIQPLTQVKYNRIFYGVLLNSVQDIIKKIQKSKQ